MSSSIWVHIQGRNELYNGEWLTFTIPVQNEWHRNAKLKLHSVSMSSIIDKNYVANAVAPNVIDLLINDQSLTLTTKRRKKEWSTLQGIEQSGLYEKVDMHLERMKMTHSIRVAIRYRLNVLETPLLGENVMLYMIPSWESGLNYNGLRIRFSNSNDQAPFSQPNLSARQACFFIRPTVRGTGSIELRFSVDNVNYIGYKTASTGVSGFASTTVTSLFVTNVGRKTLFISNSGATVTSYSSATTGATLWNLVGIDLSLPQYPKEIENANAIANRPNSSNYILQCGIGYINQRGSEIRYWIFAFNATEVVGVLSLARLHLMDMNDVITTYDYTLTTTPLVNEAVFVQIDLQSYPNFLTTRWKSVSFGIHPSSSGFQTMRWGPQFLTRASTSRTSQMVFPSDVSLRFDLGK